MHKIRRQLPVILSVTGILACIGLVLYLLQSSPNRSPVRAEDEYIAITECPIKDMCISPNNTFVEVDNGGAQHFYVWHSEYIINGEEFGVDSENKAVELYTQWLSEQGWDDNSADWCGITLGSGPVLTEPDSTRRVFFQPAGITEEEEYWEPHVCLYIEPISVFGQCCRIDLRTVRRIKYRHLD